MRTLDHSLTQGSPQWYLLLGHPYMQTATHPPADSGACSRLGWTAKRQQCGEDVGPPPHLKVCN